MNASLKVLICGIAGTLLAGCAADKPSHYYTLMATPAQTHVAGMAAPDYAISVQPVELPEQVDRPQIVLTDPASTQVMPLGDSLWAGPLSTQLRNVLSYELSSQLGALDVASTGMPDTLAVWKVFMQVQRFQSIYNERVLIDATWRLTPVNQGKKRSMICRGVAQTTVQQGVSALVAGHQQSMQELAALIAQQIKTGKTPVSTPNVNLMGCTYS
ncbi:ABC-type transport auxiliary lipoprotein family protein [Pusillimonas sp. MFBS29]|uniref:PqiC family protein n=1 Tax=Pusillimonas sp. MFBS29 TaxID=2886690 RepID=UPI001D0FB78C|nr:ABC-type transport auxiliary lipoprotein family protein [Pusillimonas sp. MFBS29]MCC2596729.1 ABC-type transport auxiliary lipoprotein family protein [Pusillimonas sp. MFBS29]